MTRDDIRRWLDVREAGGLPDQRPTSEQLRDLARVADLLGLYDAADAIRSRLGGQRGPR